MLIEFVYLMDQSKITNSQTMSLLVKAALLKKNLIKALSVFLLLKLSIKRVQVMNVKVLKILASINTMIRINRLKLSLDSALVDSHHLVAPTALIFIPVLIRSFFMKLLLNSVVIAIHFQEPIYTNVSTLI